MTADGARITLDFDLRTTPIEGLLRANDGVEQPFVGYMQLVTALETALGNARRDKTRRDSRSATVADRDVHPAGASNGRNVPRKEEP
jgi:hypothetical protein